MSKKLGAVRVLVVVVLCAVSALAQKNDLSLTLGGYFPTGSHVPTNNAFAIQGNYGRRFFHVPLASLYVEVPVAGAFNANAFTEGHLTSLGSYSALFVTPGLRVKLAPEFPISPYFAVGGGIVRFSTTGSTLQNSNTSTDGVFDAAAGLEWKIFPYLSLRGEVRDYYSGRPQLLPNTTENLNQLTATGGIVLRF